MYSLSLKPSSYTISTRFASGGKGTPPVNPDEGGTLPDGNRTESFAQQNLEEQVKAQGSLLAELSKKVEKVQIDDVKRSLDNL